MSQWLGIAGVCCLAALTRLSIGILFPPRPAPWKVTASGEPQPPTEDVAHEPPQVPPPAGGTGADNAGPPPSSLGTSTSMAWRAHLTGIRSEAHWRAIYEAYAEAARVPEYHNQYDAAPVRALGQEPTRAGGVTARSSDLMMFEPVDSLRARISARNQTGASVFADGMFGLLGWRLGNELDISVGLQTGGHELGAKDLARSLVSRQRGSWRELTDQQRTRIGDAVLHLLRTYEQGRRTLWARLWASQRSGHPIEGRVAGVRWGAGQFQLMREGESAVVDELTGRLESQIAHLRQRMDEFFR